MAFKDKLVPKTLWISESLWKRIKQYSSDNHLRISMVIREAVKESLRQKKLLD